VTIVFHNEQDHSVLIVFINLFDYNNEAGDDLKLSQPIYRNRLKV